MTEIEQLREQLHTAEVVRDDARRSSQANLDRRRELEDQLQTLADESFGPFPVQSADENIIAIGRGVSDQHRRIANATIMLEAVLQTTLPVSAASDIGRVRLVLVTRADLERVLVKPEVGQLVQAREDIDQLVAWIEDIAEPCTLSDVLGPGDAERFEELKARWGMP